MLAHSSALVRTWLAALLLACVCLLPTGSLTTEWTSADDSATYTPAHQGIFHWAGYRPPAPIASCDLRLSRAILVEPPATVLFLLVFLLELLLFLVQKRLHWLKLMPLKFGSRFLDNALFRTMQLSGKGASSNYEI
ncbi:MULTISPECIES: hypothetical protein [Brevibacillus]|nr:MULTISPECIES: hypothetical protein [Brevibacillus]MDR4998654.1 hypothetical protein [Brevibacillus parabrevis]